MFKKANIKFIINKAILEGIFFIYYTLPSRASGSFLFYISMGCLREPQAATLVEMIAA